MTRLSIARSSASTVEIDGRELLYFGGCDYLGLAHHPRVVAALVEGAARCGVSAGASRETSGNSCEHEGLEADLARRLGFEAALLLPEGYTANFALAQAIADERDTALIDEASHASLFDAAALARLEVIAVAHGDVERFRKLLGERDGRRTVLMSDAVFPSRGRIAPARELATLAATSGALLVLDDCHGTGVVGAHGRGVHEELDLSGEHVVVTSTLSKALGCYGGFVAGSARCIRRVRERSNVYVGSTPIPPALAAAGRVALELAYEDDGLVRRMRANSACLRAGFERLGLRTPSADVPVFAFELESAARMQRLHEELKAEHILAPYVHYPGGPSAGNFRVVVTAAHESEHLDRLVAALTRLMERAP